MISYQGVLEKAVHKLTEEEAKDILMDIAVSLSGSEEEKERCHDLIMEIVNKRVLSKLQWYRVSLMDIEGNEYVGVSVEAGSKEEALAYGKDYYQEELVGELWSLEAELEHE
ncbi:hypothetical protein LIT32_18040 [Bacillus sp. CMF21]|nr:hypothetical protein LIT32_18040 [Bacillus sp. CMF21]